MPGLGRRLRAAARPSLGLALTAAGVLVAIVALAAGLGHDGERATGPPVRVCRTEVTRASVERHAAGP